MAGFDPGVATKGYPSVKREAQDAGQARGDPGRSRGCGQIDGHDACSSGRQEGDPLTNGSLAGLIRTIEGEVIPRLILAHRGADPSSPAQSAGDRHPTQAEVQELTQMVLAHRSDIALAYIEALRAEGISLESIYLELLTPTARRLGEFWLEDICSFSEVTIALGRLQQILRELSRGFRSERGLPALACGEGRRALIVTAPGEQHAFGVLMVAEFLRRGGWDVSGEPGLSMTDLTEIVRDEWFAVVGLSLSCDDGVETLARGINSIRCASRNRAIGVLVGGRVFVDRPDLVGHIEADGTARDGKIATEEAERILARQPARC